MPYWIIQIPHDAYNPTDRYRVIDLDSFYANLADASAEVTVAGEFDDYSSADVLRNTLIAKGEIDAED